MFLEHPLRLVHGEVMKQDGLAFRPAGFPLRDLDAGRGRQVNQLDGLQGTGHLHGNGIGVEPIGAAFAVAAEGRNNRHDVICQQRLQERHVHTLDPAGELEIHAL